MANTRHTSFKLIGDSTSENVNWILDCSGVFRCGCLFQLGNLVLVQTVVLKVAMTCGGCVGAVKKAIAKLDGVDSYDIDLKEQKVTITGNVKPDDVLDRISRTGKATTFWHGE
jgi:copper chaperone